MKDHPRLVEARQGDQGVRLALPNHHCLEGERLNLDLGLRAAALSASSLGSPVVSFSLFLGSRLP